MENILEHTLIVLPKYKKMFCLIRKMRQNRSYDLYIL